MPSFRVQFRGAKFGGAARFVPASQLADAEPGTKFDVEISQVCGILSSIEYFSEPANNQYTNVVAGDALFGLALRDIGALRPAIGAAVKFVVHDVTLWDEAI